MTILAPYFSNPAAPPVTVLLEIQPDAVLIKGAGLANPLWSLSELNIQGIEGSHKWKMECESLPGQSLVIEKREMLVNIVQANPAFTDKFGYLIASKKRKVSALAVAVVLGFCGVVVFFWKGIPLVADVAAGYVPQEWVNSLGNEMYQAMLKEEKVNPRQTALLQQFYNNLTPPEEAKGQPPIELTVIEKDELNAFAIPGRRIVVYSGVFSRIGTYEELMALLGHEAGHVEGRHALRTLFRSMSLYAVFSVFLGDLSGFAAVLVQNAQMLQSLSYSRDFEREADTQSHLLLCRNHADPRATVWLMEAMQKEHSDLKTERIDFLSTHPLTEERIDNAHQAIANQPCGRVEKNAVLARIFDNLRPGSY